MRHVGVLFIVAAAAGLGGCHPFARLHADCHRPQEYLKAQQNAPLVVPQGLDTPNTKDALVIPTVEVTRPPPGPKDPCLDVPPRYKAAPPNKAASG